MFEVKFLGVSPNDHIGTILQYTEGEETFRGTRRLEMPGHRGLKVV